MIFSRLNTISTLLFFAILAVSANAQNNINYPQALFQYQTNVPFSGDNSERYYSFVAKGNVSITFDLKAYSDNAGVYIDFINSKGKSLAEVELSQAVNRGSDRIVKNLSLGKKFQTVILKVKSLSFGSRASYPGNLKVSLNGYFAGFQSDNNWGSSSFNEIDFESETQLNWVGREIDSPRMLNTRYSVLNFRGDNKEQYVAFYGQGKIEITYDVKANGTNAGVYLNLLDENGEEIAPQEVAQGVNGGTNRVTQSIQLNGRQLVIIKIVSISYGSNGSYPGRLKITLNSGFAE